MAEVAATEAWANDHPLLRLASPFFARRAAAPRRVPGSCVDGRPGHPTDADHVVEVSYRTIWNIPVGRLHFTCGGTGFRRGAAPRDRS